MSGRINGIIWDWNGTLLDDILHSVATINGLLKRRGIPELSLGRYKDVFSFPVKDYYEKIGFDFSKEPFEIPAREFIDAYNSGVSDCALHDQAVATLEFFRQQNFQQFIVSAMQQETLDQCIEHYRIGQYFERVSGLDNHYAASKIENARQMIADLQLNPAELILIGDTIHDFEVASELGCRCILVTCGHQSREVLQTTGTTIADDLEQLKSLLLNN